MDDPTQTAVYIPYAPEDGVERERAAIAAHRLSWTRCLAHLRSGIDELYSPTIDSILHRISTTHEQDILPGLPYPELPFIAVHNASAPFVAALLARLPNNALPSSHLYHSDAPNLPTAMRTLISNFLDAHTRAKPSHTKLAAYDIKLLNLYFTPSEPLLVILHDLEQFEPDVIQDLLYICSTCVPSLHLTFLVFLSSPARTSTSASYIHATYSRSTLARLRIHTFSVQSGDSLLERVLSHLFFNPSFEPDVVFGPTALEGIIDHYTRHNGSLDALITSIQLVHLKHFSVEPLSLLIHPLPPSSDAYTPTLDLLQSRIPTPSSSPSALLSMFEEHSTAFHTACRALRLGFTLLNTAIGFLFAQGYRPLTSSHGGANPSTSTIDLILATMKGQTKREVKTLGIYIKKLRPDILRSLLEKLLEVYGAFPEENKPDKDQIRSFLSQHSTNGGDTEDELDATDVSLWFSGRLTSLLTPLEKLPLWDVWYTGSSPFPSELLNPSPRASIISALLRPHSFTAPLPSPYQEKDTNPLLSPTVSDLESRLSPTHFHLQSHTEPHLELHNLPDTSILFARYLDSGRLINIYDWYESFKVCLDAQRADRLALMQSHSSKGKGKRKDKGKGKRKKTTSTEKKGKHKSNGDEKHELATEEGEEPDEEAWHREVQARFIRALHELDYLGFLKHTARKKEHVARTVFDVGDVEEGEQDVDEERQGDSSEA